MAALQKRGRMSYSRCNNEEVAVLSSYLKGHGEINFGCKVFDPYSTEEQRRSSRALFTPQQTAEKFERIEFKESLHQIKNPWLERAKSAILFVQAMGSTIYVT